MAPPGPVGSARDAARGPRGEVLCASTRTPGPVHASKRALQRVLCKHEGRSESPFHTRELRVGAFRRLARIRKTPRPRALGHGRMPALVGTAPVTRGQCARVRFALVSASTDCGQLSARALTAQLRARTRARAHTHTHTYTQLTLYSVTSL